MTQQFVGMIVVERTVGLSVVGQSVGVDLHVVGRCVVGQIVVIIGDTGMEVGFSKEDTGFGVVDPAVGFDDKMMFKHGPF